MTRTLLPQRRRASLRLPLLLLFALGLGASPARAQSLALSAGVTALPGGSLGLNAGLSLRNVLILGGYGVDARLWGDFGEGAALRLDGLITLPSGALTLYAGPGFSLGGGRHRFLALTLTGGLSATLNSQLGVYGEATLESGFEASGRAGLTFSF